MESFKIIIDGKECEAYPGETVLEVAERNGIVIPVFCYHKELRPEGACRVCLVEVEGAPRLATACTLRAMPDMVVKTNTERVKKARARVIELILNNHTLECPICDKAGECELQMVGFRYGPKKSRYREPRREKDIVIQGPLIEIDNDRCILCRRCIRMCGENMGNRVLGIFNRGYKAYISPFNGDFLEGGCEHCGSCIDVCPVGSLLDRAFKYKDRPWRMEKTWTTCTLCGSGCKMEVDTYHGKVKRVVGRIGINNGHNRGYLCVRGKWGWDIVYSDKRLKKPLLKKGEELKEISLEEALRILKEKIEGKEINLFLESSLTNEELSKLSAVFGNTNVTSDALTFSLAVEGIASITGERRTASFSSTEKSDVVFVIGDFIEEVNPVIATLLRLLVIQKGKRLIRVGSYPSKLDAVAFSSLIVSPEEVIDLLKHFIMGTIDLYYSSGDRKIDSAAKALRNKKVAFIIGGTTLFSPDIKEISQTVAYLADRMGNATITVIPPKANSIGVTKLFDLKPPEKLKGSVNVLVNTELERDFPGIELPKAEFTVVFTPFYTHDIAKADLVIPIETGVEKEGKVEGIERTLDLKRAVVPKYQLTEIISQLPYREGSREKRELKIKKKPGESILSGEKGEIYFTLLVNRTGWNSVSYYSGNVAKVAGRRELHLHPEDAKGRKIVTLKGEHGELPISVVENDSLIPGTAVLRVERVTRDLKGLVKFPFTSNFKCRIAEE